MQKDKEVATEISKDLLLNKLMEKKSPTSAERSIIKNKLASINARIRIPDFSEVRTRYKTIRDEYFSGLRAIQG